MSLLEYSQLISFSIVSQFHWPIKIKMMLNSQQFTVPLTCENHVSHFCIKPFFIFLAIILKRNLVKIKSLGKKNTLQLISWKGWGSYRTEIAFFGYFPHPENKFLLFLNVRGCVCFKIAALSRWCVPVQEAASEPKIPGQCRCSTTWVINSNHISFAKQKESFLECKGIFPNFLLQFFRKLCTSLFNIVLSFRLLKCAWVSVQLKQIPEYSQVLPRFPRASLTIFS